MVALLLGHIQLHRLQLPKQATLTALAEQGLGLCRSQNTVISAATTTPSTDVVLPDLLKDPFLTTNPDQVRPAQPHVVAAMPWLPSDEEPRPRPNAAGTPSPDPAPTPETAVTLEPEITTEPTEQPPSDVVEPTPQEPAAKTLLEKSWLHRQLQPAIKSPIGAVESVGLMNRIKGPFARSAGR